jgi:putative ABC transport system permease protein
MLAGAAMAELLLRWRLNLSAAGQVWFGLITAVGVSGFSLGLGARYLLKQMRLSPAALLRAGT